MRSPEAPDVFWSLLDASEKLMAAIERSEGCDFPVFRSKAKLQPDQKQAKQPKPKRPKGTTRNKHVQDDSKLLLKSQEVKEIDMQWLERHLYSSSIAEQMTLFYIT